MSHISSQRLAIIVNQAVAFTFVIFSQVSFLLLLYSNLSNFAKYGSFSSIFDFSSLAPGELNV
ncbi:TPA: hypothetical protein DEG21_04585 [Patescibacteria group bacterium]|nr:hypothetical protein [Candidatus Gracilibacteria bacterium]HBY75112.1 hypothetical protein [Candidatus Gracilibacteria bacterium]